MISQSRSFSLKPTIRRWQLLGKHLAFIHVDLCEEGGESAEGALLAGAGDVSSEEISFSRRGK